MELVDFFESYLPLLPIQSYIVKLKLKYDWEAEYRYINELLTVNMNVPGSYVWFSDWNEGEEDIEVVGCVALCDVEVPPLRSDVC